MYVKHEIGTETTNTSNKNSLDFDLSSTPINEAVLQKDFR